MSIGTRKTRALALLLFAAACTRTDLQTIDLSDRIDVVAFILLMDEADRPLRVTRPFGVEGGSISFGDRPQLELTGAEVSAVLVELDGGALHEAHPDFAAARASEIAVRLEAPPAEPALLFGVDLATPSKETALPEESKLTPLLDDRELGADERRSILGALTLALPVDPEHCRPTSAAFEPFGVDETVIAAGDRMARSLDTVVRVRDRALLRTPLAIHVLDRGAALDPARSFEGTAIADPGSIASFTDLAIDPRGDDGGARLIALAQIDPGDGPRDSVVVELRLDPSGALEHVRTATRVEAQLESVAISSGGRVAAISRDALVYLEEPDGSFSRHPLDHDDLDPKGRAVLWTDDPARPVIATSRNRVHFWDPVTQRFVAERITLDLEVSLHLPALAKRIDPGGTSEIWGGGNNGFLMRSRDGSVERIPIAVPPRYLDCSTAQGDLSLFEDDIEDLALMDGHVYLALKRCSALMVLRMSDGCVSLSSIDGTEPHIIDQGVLGIRSIDARDGEVLVTDAASRAYSLRP